MLYDDTYSGPSFFFVLSVHGFPFLNNSGSNDVAYTILKVMINTCSLAKPSSQTKDYEIGISCFY